MSEYDALADLFLSDGGPAIKAKPASLRLTGGSPARTDSVASSPTQEVVAEGLILGHLPVLGAAWVMQYAKHTADRLGEPVGLLRVQGGQASVDVIGGRGQPRIETLNNERSSLEEGIAAARRWARYWLVRVDDTSEPDLAGIPGLNAVTLLTGADDAAIVASYRTMKGLHALSSDGPAPALQLAIMGAPEDKATAAEAKLRRASMTFLGRDIDAAARVAKIGPSAALPFYRGDWARGLEGAVALLRSEAPAVDPQAVIAAPPLPTVEPKPAPIETVVVPERTRDIAPARAPTVVLPEGLTLLDITCPYAPAVMLASENDGTLHLLARGGSDSVPSLLAAAAWAGEHAKLLARAFPAIHERTIQAGPVLHVTTDDARSARGLLDTAVRVHLVVEVGGRVVLKPLN